MTLTYIGNGSNLNGVPAHDLTDEDVAALEQFGFSEKLLLKSGIYEKPVISTKEPPATGHATTGGNQ
jgi:hypothetical protein